MPRRDVSTWCSAIGVTVVAHRYTPRQRSGDNDQRSNRRNIQECTHRVVVDGGVISMSLDSFDVWSVCTDKGLRLLCVTRADGSELMDHVGNLASAEAFSSLRPVDHSVLTSWGRAQYPTRRRGLAVSLAVNTLAVRTFTNARLMLPVATTPQRRTYGSDMVMETVGKFEGQGRELVIPTRIDCA